MPALEVCATRLYFPCLFSWVAECVITLQLFGWLWKNLQRACSRTEVIGLSSRPALICKLIAILLKYFTRKSLLCFKLHGYTTLFYVLCFATGSSRCFKVLIVRMILERTRESPLVYHRMQRLQRTLEWRNPVTNQWYLSFLFQKICHEDRVNRTWAFQE